MIMAGFAVFLALVGLLLLCRLSPACVGFVFGVGLLAALVGAVWLGGCLARVGRPCCFPKVARLRKTWYNISHNLSFGGTIVMWNIVKFMSNFPMPSQQTPEQRRLVNRYMRLWHQKLREDIQRDKESNEEYFIRHCYNNAFFGSWE